MADRDPIVDRSFVLTIGWIVRRAVIVQVKQCAWETGLEIRHERAGADVKFTVSGSARAADRFVRSICLAIAA